MVLQGDCGTTPCTLQTTVGFCHVGNEVEPKVLTFLVHKKPLRAIPHAQKS